MDAKKILIADDEQDVLNVLTKKLVQKNFLVTAVSRGKDAIEKCKLDKPDVILLDIVMPDMDGYEVASAIREEEGLKDVPIIFLTGKELEHTGIERRVEDIGAYDYLIKPCTFDEIVNKIKEVLHS